jgi:hypothetical protein
MNERNGGFEATSLKEWSNKKTLNKKEGLKAIKGQMDLILRSNLSAKDKMRELDSLQQEADLLEKDRRIIDGEPTEPETIDIPKKTDPEQETSTKESAPMKVGLTVEMQSKLKELGWSNVDLMQMSISQAEEVISKGTKYSDVFSQDRHNSKNPQEKVIVEKSPEEKHKEYLEAEKAQGERWGDYSLATKVLNKVNSFTGGKLDLPSFIKMDDSEYQRVLASLNQEQTKEIEKIIAGEKTEETTIEEPINVEKKGLFRRSLEKAGRLARGSYELAYKKARESTIVGKLEIAYNQSQIDKLDGYATDIKNIITEIDEDIAKLDQAKTDIEGAVTTLKAQNESTLSLQLKLRVIEAQKSELERKKRKSEQELEKLNRQAKPFTEKKAKIADKLIERYDGKLEPMEEELEKLEAELAALDLLIAAQTIRNEEKMAELADLEKQKSNLERAFEAIGMSDRKIRKDQTIKRITERIQYEQDKMTREGEALENKRTVLENKVAQTNEKAAPFREKRALFQDLKAKKPLGQTAEEARVAGTVNSTTPDNTNPTTNTTPEDSTTIETEKFPISNFIKEYNTYLKRFLKAEQSELIDKDTFLKATKFKEGHKLEPKKFKELLLLYYKMKKLHLGKFNKAMSKMTVFKNIQ